MENLATQLIESKKYYLGNLALKSIIYEKGDDFLVLNADAFHKGEWYSANLIVNFSQLNTLLGKIEPASDSFSLADLISRELLENPFEIGELDVKHFFGKTLKIFDLKLRVKLMPIIEETLPENAFFFIVEKILHNGRSIMESKVKNKTR
jgi:hypothetical protein